MTPLPKPSHTTYSLPDRLDARQSAARQAIRAFQTNLYTAARLAHVVADALRSTE